MLGRPTGRELTGVASWADGVITDRPGQRATRGVERVTQVALTSWTERPLTA